MLSVTLLILYLLIIWIYVLWSRRKYYKLMLQFPGPKGYPLIGVAYKFFNKKSVLEVFHKESENFGSNALTWFMTFPILAANDPETIQDVLNSPHTINKAKVMYTNLQQVIGNGLVLIKDSIWHIHRRSMNPLFYQTSLMNFFPIFNTESSLLVEELNNLVDKGEHSLTFMLKRFTLGISSQTVWGSDVKSEEQYKNFTLTKMFDKVIEAGIQLAVSPWLNNKIMRKVSGIENVLMKENEIIRHKVRECVNKQVDIHKSKKDQHEKTNSFIELAVDQMNMNIFSTQDIVDEAHALIIAAFETTAFTLNYALMFLGMHPEYQEKVFEELQSVFPNRGNFDVHYEDLDKLVYLDLVIKETLRLTPAVPLIARVTSQEVKLSSGVLLPKGLQIVMSPYVLHRRKDIWGSDANFFNPDNFLPANLEKKHRYAYIPFSRGKRNCIGWKYAMFVLRITLSKLLRNYKFSTNFRYEDMVIENSLSFKLKQMPKFILEYRK